MPGKSADEVYERILAAVRAVEDLPYEGEAVDQLQHALQCAALAREAGYDSEMVVAALLHDMGRSPVVVQEVGMSGGHGNVAGRWLAPLVGERIAWLVEQHVPAKRYLVATDPSYELSETSWRTLLAQGGPMSAQEVAEFEKHPAWRDALMLRRWDDLGKDPYAKVPSLETYSGDIKVVIAAHANGFGPV